VADTATDQWGTLTLEVPDFLEDTRNAINSVAEFLITVLDIMLVALNIAKAYLIGYIDPIAAIVKALIDEIKGLLKDLRQMGIYITGDWPLMKYPFKELRGGFAEYERRMIARLTDRTDPTRPNLSSRTAILSLFFYLSVDISDIQRLIAFILKLIQFFKQEYKTPGGFPVPTITEIKYGNDALSVWQIEDLGAFFKKGDGTPPNVAQVKWVATVPTKKNPFDPFPPMPPGGYIVTVSTFENGIPVVWDRGQSNAGTVGGQQPRDFGPVKDEGNDNFVLYGGAEMLAGFPADLQYNNSLKGDVKIEDGRTRIYGRTPTGIPIPLESLKDGDTYFFQRTFFMSVNIGEKWVGDALSYLLKTEDMPHDASVSMDSSTGEVTIEDDGPAHTLYVRVASTSEAIGSKEVEFQYDFSKYLPLKDDTTRPPMVTTKDADGPYSSISEFSQPWPVVFPNVNTQQYLEAVQVALVVLVLSRPDLTPIDTLENVIDAEKLKLMQANQLIVPGLALERSGLEKFQHLVGFIYKDFAKKLRDTREEDPTKMRDHILTWVRATAHDLYSKTGPLPEAEAAVVDATEALRSVLWGNIIKEVSPDLFHYLPEATVLSTILESMDTDVSGNILDAGVALNPYCMGVAPSTVQQFFFIDGVFQERRPQMQEGKVGGTDDKFKVTPTVAAEGAETFMRALPPSLRIFYEKYRQEDGSYVVPDEDRASMNTLVATQQTVGSADLSPVFYVGQRELIKVRSANPPPANVPGAGVIFCRGAFAKYQGGQLLQEAALALGVAGAALNRSPDDGEWIAIRFLDQFPAIEEVMAQFLNWVEAIAKTLESVTDTIQKYIEFIEARIIELQQLIRRINALVQSMLGYTFQIPKCSALMLYSNGTGGVMADLVAAQNKPNDKPLAFGAGIAVVIPVGPAFIMDIIKLIMSVTQGESEGFLSEEGQLAPVVGIEGIPEEPPVPPDPEPDVL